MAALWRYALCDRFLVFKNKFYTFRYGDNFFEIIHCVKHLIYYIILKYYAAQYRNDLGSAWA